MSSAFKIDVSSGHEDGSVHVNIKIDHRTMRRERIRRRLLKEAGISPFTDPYSEKARKALKLAAMREVKEQLTRDLEGFSVDETVAEIERRSSEILRQLAREN